VSEYPDDYADVIPSKFLRTTSGADLQQDNFRQVRQAAIEPGLVAGTFGRESGRLAS
jgi:hypothetical protein